MSTSQKNGSNSCLSCWFLFYLLIWKITDLCNRINPLVRKENVLSSRHKFIILFWPWYKFHWRFAFNADLISISKCVNFFLFWFYFVISYYIKLFPFAFSFISYFLCWPITQVEKYLIARNLSKHMKIKICYVCNNFCCLTT